MKASRVLSRLKSLGTEQTRKTYARHGVEGALGVLYSDFYKLAKEIKVDHDLAVELWDSGYFDARVVAGMVADPEKFNASTANAWMRQVTNKGLLVVLSDLFARSTVGRRQWPKWLKAKGEWTPATAWGMVGSMLRDGIAFTKTEARGLLATIEKDIHKSENRVKYSMNNALIALGTYVPGFEQEAVRVAKRIGQVEVDHGLTDCKTPLAAPYIRKAAAHHRAKLAKQAAAAKKKAAKTAKKKAAAKRKATAKTRRKAASAE